MKSIKLWFNLRNQSCPDFKARGLGIRERMRPGIVNRPQGTQDYLFMFFYDPALLRTGGQTIWQTPPFGMIWDNQQGHYYGNPDRPWLHSWMHVCGDAVRHLLAESKLPVNSPFSMNALPLVEHYLLLFLNELTLNDKPDGVILRNIFHCWLRELARRVCSGGNVSRVPEKIRAVKSFIETHYTEPMALADLARQANCSIPHFCSQFKRYFGCSAIDYAICLRLDMAAYYLQDRNIRVSEVATRVGYDDIYYFSRLFKKRFGQSPRQMKRIIQTPHIQPVHGKLSRRHIAPQSE